MNITAVIVAVMYILNLSICSFLKIKTESTISATIITKLPIVINVLSLLEKIFKYFAKFQL